MKVEAEHKNADVLNGLERLIEGDVHTDELSKALYSSGACLYRVRPLGIVQPKHRADVVNVMRYAGERGIPVTARGGGTSRSGNELGEGIILDFSKHMTSIPEYDHQGKWVRVQPGVILSTMNTSLKSSGLFFPIDPSTGDFCTLGGMIANNSSGPQAVKYGTTRDHVLSLEVVLFNGEVIQTGPVPLKRKEKYAERLEREIYNRMPEILGRYDDPLRDERPFTTKNSAGYNLWGLQHKGILDLTPLFVGSEGTLGIVTEAKLKLAPIPAQVLSGLLCFDDLSGVSEATQKILELSPSILDIMERQILDLARAQKAEMKSYLPEGIEALLFIQFQGDGSDDLHQKFKAVEKKIIHEGKLACDLKVAKNKKDMEVFAKVRSISGPILNNIKGPKKPVAFIEDAAVHPSRLPRYINGLRELFKTYQVDAGIYGHAGDGNLHSMVFMDLTQEDEVKKMAALAEAVYDLVLDLKGTISAEHGDGRLRTYYLKKQYPKLYPAFKEIKTLFDPQNVLNPGCIVGGEHNLLTRHFKYGVDYQIVPTGSAFDQESLRTEVETCSGCGNCRSYCPIARQVHEEWAMGRGKATLLREILSGHLDPDILESLELKKIMDSCINCKKCLTECPSGVDIPWLSVSSRAAYLDRHGESLGDRLLDSADWVFKTGSALAPLINQANSLPPFRGVLEKTVGLDRRRHLPRFQARNLRKIVKGRLKKRGAKKIVYFPGCYACFVDPEGDGMATVEVLEYNGFSPLISDFRCCGIARIKSGAISRVMGDIKFNIEKMASYVEQGLDIVFSEPSCALAFKMEYPKILKKETAKRVAGKCYDIHQFLMMLHKKGELRMNFGELNLTVGYHSPCHLRALGVAREPVEMLRLIPGVKVKEFIDDCCGLGGGFGMKKDNFDLSMEVGSRLFKEMQEAGVDEIATSCGACKMQIFQGTRRKAIHPVSLLARAYKEGNRSRVQGSEA